METDNFPPPSITKQYYCGCHCCRQLASFLFSSDWQLPTTQDKTRVYSFIKSIMETWKAASLSGSPVSLNFPKRFCARWHTKQQSWAKFIGNQSTGQWCLKFTVSTLCHQHFIMIRSHKKLVYCQFKSKLKQILLLWGRQIKVIIKWLTVVLLVSVHNWFMSEFMKLACLFWWCFTRGTLPGWINDSKFSCTDNGSSA